MKQTSIAIPTPVGQRELVRHRLAWKDTTIVFDWDDTLLATSFLSSFTMEGQEMMCTPVSIPKEMLPVFALMERYIYQLFCLAQSLGRLTIVTNAQVRWVEWSARQYLPRIAPLLKKIRIISARDLYAHRFPRDPVKWKVLAFSSILQTHPNTRNFVSIGDSHSEREAIYRSSFSGTNYRYDVLRKSIKFLSTPSPQQLLAQLRMLTKSLQVLISYTCNLDIMLAHV